VATGHAVEPALPALGIALLVLAVGIIAGRGRIRRLVGLVTALTALGTVAVAILGRGDVSSTLTGKEPGGLGIAVHAGANGWWIVALAGGLLALACGAATLAYGPRWAALGAKYEAPQADRAPIAASVDEWDALDRGEDPTT
jgi:formate hydrogenlyase subunit 3/multisubunit Na+/H+ antiporter MnhD subunit